MAYHIKLIEVLPQCLEHLESECLEYLINKLVDYQTL